jgi:molybdate transport system substrate-binding protein
MKQHTMTAAAVGFAMLAAGNWAGAADIKVISSNALKTTLEQLAPGFEKSTGHKLVFTFGAAVPLKAQIEKGATFDLAVLTTDGVDDLIKQGKLVGASRTALANSGAGVAVRKGAPKPDISTVEAFKRALLRCQVGRLCRAGRHRDLSQGAAGASRHRRRAGEPSEAPAARKSRRPRRRQRRG